MPGINGSYDAVFPSNDTVIKTSEQQVENGGSPKKENSIFYSSYDDNKNKTIELSDATTKKYIDNGCNVQEDSSLAQNVKAKIKTSIAELYKKATANFSNFGYNTANSTPDVEVESNLSRQVQGFNQATQTSYSELIKQAKLEAEQELSESQKKENALKANDKLKISNEYNQNNGIEGDFTTTADENGNIKTITVKSDKSGNQFTYQRNEDGNFVQVDKNGNQVKDKNGNVKEYSLSDDGNLQRTNNEITLNGKTYTKNAYGDYDYNGKSYFYDNGQMIPIQQLDEVVVIGDKSKVKTPKIDLASTVIPKSPDIDLPKIDMDPLRGSLAKASLKEQGAKFIEREVNGEQREIAVYHNSEGEKVRQVVNDDGSIENLVATSTLGKNKYITQTEANKELTKLFGSDVANILIENGGTPVYQDGKITAVKVNGKEMTDSELNKFVKTQIETKNDASTVPETPASTVNPQATDALPNESSQTQSNDAPKVKISAGSIMTRSGSRHVVLKSNYQADGKTLISDQFINSSISGVQVVSQRNYENGSVANVETDLSQYDSNASLGSLSKEFAVAHTMQKNASRATSSEVKNNEGEVILSFKDGQFFNSKGKTIEFDKAVKILEKADKKGELKKLIQNMV